MKVTILSGVPGSGKSTYARNLGADVVSADDYLPLKPQGADFGIAHAKCMAYFQLLVMQHVAHVVVDNTNTTAVEIAPYYLVAQAHDAEVTVLRFTCDAEAAFRRNVHQVPFQTFAVMLANFLRRDVMPWWHVEDL